MNKGEYIFFDLVKGYPFEFLKLTLFTYIILFLAFYYAYSRDKDNRQRQFSFIYSCITLTFIVAPLIAWMFTYLYAPEDISLLNAFTLPGSLAVMFMYFMISVMFIYCMAASMNRGTVQMIEKSRTLDGGGDLDQSLIIAPEALGSILVAYGPPRNPQEFGEFNETRTGFRVKGDERALCLGCPGSGKTAFLVSQIVDWMKSGQSFVVSDIKPEIWARLHDNNIFKIFGYSVYVINPTNPHAHNYNIFNEYGSVSELSEIMQAIIPKSADAQGEKFNQNARRVLMAVLLHLKDKASLPAARRFINKAGGIDKLLTYLQNSDNETVQDIATEVRHTANNERLMSSIMTALIQAFEFFDDTTIRDSISSSDFNLKDILKQPRTAIFLQFEQATSKTTSTLFGAIVYRTLKILQSNHYERQGRNVLVLLDEFINSAPIPNFIQLLNTLRSANVPIWLYTQNLEGLNTLYGKDTADQFLASAGLHICFRITSIQSAKVLSEEVGKAETTYRSISRGAQNSQRFSNGVRRPDEINSMTDNLSESTQLDAIIEPEEILALPNHVALAFYQGKAGILNMPIYWHDFPMSVKSTLERPSQDQLN